MKTLEWTHLSHNSSNERVRYVTSFIQLRVGNTQRRPYISDLVTSVQTRAVDSRQ